MKKVIAIRSIALSRRALLIIFTATAVTITALVGAVYYLMYKDAAVFEYDDSSVVGLMPGVDRDAMLSMLQDNADKTAIAFSINSAPTVIKQTMNLLFENPEGNGKDISITLYDNETGETIYQSKAIKEGSYLSNVRLEKNYELGNHTVTAYITAYDSSTHELIGEAAAELTLNVAEAS